MGRAGVEGGRAVPGKAPGSQEFGQPQGAQARAQVPKQVASAPLLHGRKTNSLEFMIARQKAARLCSAMNDFAALASSALGERPKALR